MSTIRDALDNLAEKVGVAEAAANDLTIADKIDTITAAISTPSNSKDIAEAVEKFGEAMPEYEASYDLLETEPSDWSTKYFNYYYKDGSDYLSVTKVAQYDVTTEEPTDWETNYASYYTKDGDVYTAVVGVDSYTLTTEEPADWSTNYTDYFTESGGVYTPVTGETAPTWEASTYYSYDGVVAPTWSASTYYAKSMVVPTFVTNTYYKKDNWS